MGSEVTSDPAYRPSSEVVSIGMSFSEGIDGTNSQGRFPNPSASLLAMGKVLQSKSSALSLACELLLVWLWLDRLTDKSSSLLLY